MTKKDGFTNTRSYGSGDGVNTTVTGGGSSVKVGGGGSGSGSGRRPTNNNWKSVLGCTRTSLIVFRFCLGCLLTIELVLRFRFLVSLKKSQLSAVSYIPYLAERSLLLHTDISYLIV